MFIEAVKRIFSVGNCVICDAPTHTQFVNQDNGLEYVHNYHEPEYIGCKEVWRYLQDKQHKEDRKELERKAKEGDECAIDLLSWGGEDEILDEKDYYIPGDYRSYIQSREWKIKADYCKQSVGFVCQDCGKGGVLHAHHLTYKRLFREQRQDIRVLCPDCHLKETVKGKRRKVVYVVDNLVS